MLIGRQGDAQKSHWKVQAVKTAQYLSSPGVLASFLLVPLIPAIPLKGVGSSASKELLLEFSTLLGLLQIHGLNLIRVVAITSIARVSLSPLNEYFVEPPFTIAIAAVLLGYVSSFTHLEYEACPHYSL
ncbi:hypothetical protein CRENBAI_010208 [Crenichthys baileyi]|uniref:Uncharacterized protein n=1 Tax=Crenichthys baileyi TaxID=28760 RepID=A0AAV9SLF9_9TELE